MVESLPVSERPSPLVGSARRLARTLTVGGEGHCRTLDRLPLSSTVHEAPPAEPYTRALPPSVLATEATRRLRDLARVELAGPGPPRTDTERAPLEALADGVVARVRRYFESLRAHGGRPHAFGAELDPVAAEVQACKAIVYTVSRLAMQPLLPAALPAGLAQWMVALDAPLGRYGVNHAVLAESVEGQEDLTDQTGDWEAILGDIALLGAGHLRQIGEPDLLWSSILPDEAIPAPRELFARLQADEYAALARMQAVLNDAVAIAAADGRLQLVPHLFTLGGGSRYSNEHLIDEGVPDLPEDLRRPAALQQHGHLPTEGHGSELNVLYTHLWGWDPWYWDHESWQDVDATPADDDVRAFCQYALGLEWEGAGNYLAEACRRKALGVAAFGCAIGEFLAVQAAAFDGDFVDFIPMLECGNELENFLRPVEMARLQALLAGPIRLCVNTARFRAGELFSPEHSFIGSVAGQVSWLEEGLGEALAEELKRWKDVEALWEWMIDPDANPPPDNLETHWQATCLSADFYWPPIPGTGWAKPTKRADELVHQVGMHYYRHKGTDRRSEQQMLADLGTLAAGLGAGSLSELGLTMSVSETGLPAVTEEDELFPQNELTQGGGVWRRVLTAEAAGASMVAWHTFMSGVKHRGAELSEFSAMGVRADVLTSDDEFTQEANAYPRASWFALNRLAWLRSKSSGPPAVVLSDSAAKFMLLSLSAGEGSAFSDPMDPGAGEYQLAWVFWVDRDGGRARSFELRSSTTIDYHLLSVTPRVEPPLEEARADQYPAPADVDWTWPGWSDLVITESADVRKLTIEVEPMDPDDRPAPFCLLTNSGVSLATVVSLIGSTRRDVDLSMSTDRDLHLSGSDTSDDQKEFVLREEEQGPLEP